MKICSVVAKLFHGHTTDRRTDMTKQVVAFRNFANAPNMSSLIIYTGIHRNFFLKCSNKMTLFCTVFYSLQTALHVSGETFIHHQELE
jgi:hypothetical protein